MLILFCASPIQHEELPFSFSFSFSFSFILFSRSVFSFLLSFFLLSFSPGLFFPFSFASFFFFLFSFRFLLLSFSKELLNTKQNKKLAKLIFSPFACKNHILCLPMNQYAVAHSVRPSLLLHKNTSVTLRCLQSKVDQKHSQLPRSGMPNSTILDSQR